MLLGVWDDMVFVVVPCLVVSHVGCVGLVLCENCIVDASFILYSFVCFLCLCVLFFVCGTRWMPWHVKPMKDVGGCVKPRGVAN